MLFGVVGNKQVSPDALELTTKCPSCKKTDIIVVPSSAMDSYARGEFIQHAFVMLNSSQREQLLTGFCDSCWQKTFSVEEEE